MKHACTSIFQVSSGNHESVNGVNKSSVSDHGERLSGDELNVVRYIGGYVARSLHKKYKRMKKFKTHSQFVDCLGELAMEGEGDDVLIYTRSGLKLKVNATSFTG